MSLAVMPTPFITGGRGVDEVSTQLTSFRYSNTRLPEEAFVLASSTVTATLSVGHHLVTATDAREAIQQLASVLQLPEKDICAAAGVKPRTFKGWKQRGHKPQVGSLGRLWNMVEVVNGLNDDLEGSFPQWLKASADRLSLFNAGQFNRLVNLAARDILSGADVLTTYEPRNLYDPEISITPARVQERRPLSGLKRDRL